MELVFERRGIFAFDQRVDIKIKRDARTAELINAILRLWASRLADFVNAFTKRADIGNDINVTFLRLLCDRECSLRRICEFLTQLL